MLYLTFNVNIFPVIVMKDNISFKMPDGLVIRGTLMGNIESPNLIVMLHSGGYDRREKA